MSLQRFTKMLLFPHIAVMIVLIPVSVVYLVYSLAFMTSDSLIAVISYVLSFYTLMVWCLRIPRLLQFFRAFKRDNRYARRWLNDTRLRVNVSLYGTLIWNSAYAVFQLCLGLWHHTFWYYSLAGYYVALAFMRFFLVRYTRKHKPGEKLLTEYRKYRVCGITFLVINLALSLMVFFMIYWNRTFIHHEITTIAMAAYTFGSLILAIVNVLKYRKYNSPVYSASKAIGLAAAAVSMLTLESTMLNTFGDGSMGLTEKRIMLGTSGGVISAFIIIMAFYMIVQSSRQIKLLGTAEDKTNG